MKVVFIITRDVNIDVWEVRFVAVFGFSWLAQDMILRAVFVGTVVDFAYSKSR